MRVPLSVVVALLPVVLRLGVRVVVESLGLFCAVSESSRLLPGLFAPIGFWVPRVLPSGGAWLLIAPGLVLLCAAVGAPGFWALTEPSRVFAGLGEPSCGAVVARDGSDGFGLVALLLAGSDGRGLVVVLWACARPVVAKTAATMAVLVAMFIN